MLGPIVKFRNGEAVGPVVEKWFHEKPNRLVKWAEAYPTLAGAWVKPDPSNDTVTNWLGTPSLDASFLVPAFVPEQQAKHAAIVKAWKEKNPDAKDDVAFFAIFAEEFPDTVPSMNQTNTSIGLGESSDIQAWFFDMWLQENPKAEIEPVPADMVTSSGSGLDPHITLRNAEYQLDRVATEWSDKKSLDKKKVEKDIEQLLHDKAFTPLLGYGGEPLVNVLEVNLALHEKYGSAAK
jgi:K+-transporting ATPase ATPase C chain